MLSRIQRLIKKDSLVPLTIIIAFIMLIWGLILVVFVDSAKAKAKETKTPVKKIKKLAMSKKQVGPGGINIYYTCVPTYPDEPTGYLFVTMFSNGEDSPTFTQYMKWEEYEKRMEPVSCNCEYIEVDASSEKEAERSDDCFISLLTR